MTSESDRDESEKWELILPEDYDVTEYACGLRAGDRLRLKKDIETHEAATGRKTGEVWRAGEIWTVLLGTSSSPGTLWLRRPNGEVLTGEDDESIFEQCERVEDEGVTE